MKLGWYFEEDCVVINTPFKRYTINYSDIEKIVYIKWTWWNYFACPYCLMPGFVHIYCFDRLKKRKVLETFVYRYKNLSDLPKIMKDKLEVIDKYHNW